MNRTLRAAALALREALGPRTLDRRPEPTPDMSDRENVRAFHAQGADDGALLGVYDFNARQISALASEGGMVVDLGCGSGQALRYFAQRRPDLRFIGFDLSTPMVEVGNEMLAREGLASRVALRVGDMTAFARQVPSDVGLVTSIFALHHLPTLDLLEACLREVREVRDRNGSGYWVFDHARPRRRETAERFPWVFTRDASRAFNADSTNSLIASWSYEELDSRIERIVGAGHARALARLLPLYQVHWALRSPGDQPDAALWREPQRLSKFAREDSVSLSGLFSGLPARHL